MLDVWAPRMTEGGESSRGFSGCRLGLGGSVRPSRPPPRARAWQNKIRAARTGGNLESRPRAKVTPQVRLEQQSHSCAGPFAGSRVGRRFDFTPGVLLLTSCCPLRRSCAGTGVKGCEQMQTSPAPVSPGSSLALRKVLAKRKVLP